jgi:hypothetical protein
MVVFYTVLSGVSVFVLGQIVIKFFIEPIHEQRKAIGKASDTLIFYAGYYSVPKQDFTQPDREEAQIKTRELSTLLLSTTQVIPWYRIFEFFCIVRKEQQIIAASRDIIGLTSDMYDEKYGLMSSTKRIKDIENALGLKLSDESLRKAASTD